MLVFASKNNRPVDGPFEARSLSTTQLRLAHPILRYD